MWKASILLSFLFLATLLMVYEGEQERKERIEAEKKTENCSMWQATAEEIAQCYSDPSLVEEIKLRWGIKIAHEETDRFNTKVLTLISKGQLNDSAVWVSKDYVKIELLDVKPGMIDFASLSEVQARPYTNKIEELKV